MNHKVRTIFFWTLHVVFCVCLVFFFGRNCILRPAACNHIYKEYLSGMAVLFIIYINHLVLFPKLYAKSRILEYILATLFSVVFAFLFEMVLVAPDILDYMYPQPTPNKSITYLAMDGFFVFLRDMSFALVSFSLTSFLYYKELNHDKESFLFNVYHKIETNSFDKSKKKIFVSLDDISYCKQQKNYTRLYLTDGSSVLRYGTLTAIMELLGESYAVQVSRSIIIPYANIVDYNKSGVVVKSNIETTMFSYSDNLATHAYNLISKNVKKTKKGDIEISREQNTKPKTVRQKKSQQRDLLYAFIAEHPGCAAAEIKRNRSISQSTVNRLLAQLKEEGKIVYTGSKKTGGYHVVAEEG